MWSHCLLMFWERERRDLAVKHLTFCHCLGYMILTRLAPFSRPVVVTTDVASDKQGVAASHSIVEGGFFLMSLVAVVAGAAVVFWGVRFYF